MKLDNYEPWQILGGIEQDILSKQFNKYYPPVTSKTLATKNTKFATKIDRKDFRSTILRFYRNTFLNLLYNLQKNQSVRSNAD